MNARRLRSYSFRLMTYPVTTYKQADKILREFEKEVRAEAKAKVRKRKN